MGRKRAAIAAALVAARSCNHRILLVVGRLVAGNGLLDILKRQKQLLANHGGGTVAPRRKSTSWVATTQPACGSAPPAFFNALENGQYLGGDDFRDGPGQERPGPALDAMVLLKPATVVEWHRMGFRLYWRWRSTFRHPGRPKTRRADQRPNDEQSPRLI